ncbi:hypothetical protein Pst134EA_026011 [Puccinia striiformis f. sp. tritici]|uniref:hypothetical protein n=1 Tax=Puccinia striiformis f. sp. tritici TaxID=168172 RepID=UPI002008D44F|nr:hypothetical protein Pst134EA_026011 [Puccinia striiformis f. sp. tritici]KAH9452076.1 hypothetical protein Pst134EA_026011 [Puccinia striiformis f. sp. tritici]
MHMNAPAPNIKKPVTKIDTALGSVNGTIRSTLKVTTPVKSNGNTGNAQADHKKGRICVDINVGPDLSEADMSEADMSEWKHTGSHGRGRFRQKIISNGKDGNRNTGMKRVCM